MAGRRSGLIRAGERSGWLAPIVTALARHNVPGIIRAPIRWVWCSLSLLRDDEIWERIA